MFNKVKSKRIMATLKQENIIKLKSIMFDFKTRQPSKVINKLIEDYKKL